MKNERVSENVCWLSILTGNDPPGSRFPDTNRGFRGSRDLRDSERIVRIYFVDGKADVICKASAIRSNSMRGFAPSVSDRFRMCKV